MSNTSSVLGRSHSRSQGHSALNRPANDNVLQVALDRFQVWRDRVRTRRHLAVMSDYQLKDIGISRADAYNEVNKPFWRG
jgi:uncharacterized protein YjiS (DUF1127 family)